MSDIVKKLLIVGGLQKEREDIQQNFKKKYPDEFEAILTDSGKEAISICKNTQPNCIILDYCLFDLDGSQVIDLINQQQPDPIIPILVLLEENEKTIAQQAIEHGALYCLAKSKVNVNTLHRIINDIIKKASLPLEERKQQAKLNGFEDLEPRAAITETVTTEASQAANDPSTSEADTTPTENSATIDESNDEEQDIDAIELNIKPAQPKPTFTTPTANEPAQETPALTPTQQAPQATPASPPTQQAPQATPASPPTQPPPQAAPATPPTQQAPQATPTSPPTQQAPQAAPTSPPAEQAPQAAPTSPPTQQAPQATPSSPPAEQAPTSPPTQQAPQAAPSNTSPTPPATAPPVTEEKELKQLATNLSGQVYTEPNEHGQVDPVTGLPNHILFKNALTRAIAHAERHGRHMALLLFDLHYLDNIITEHGQHFANQVLKVLVTKIKGKLRGNDYLARLNALGVGEFAIILDEIIDYFDAGMVAGRLLDLIREPIIIEDKQFTLSACIGIACYPIDSNSVIDFHKNAVIAMYYAKQNADEFYYFNEKLNQDNKRRLEIQKDLEKAYENQEFNLSYQPIFHLQTMDILAMQPIIRWNHPKLDIISAAEFMPIAERSHLIVNLNKWMIKQILQNYQQWQQINLKPQLIYLELSHRILLEKEFIEFLMITLEQYKISPTQVSLQFNDINIRRNLDRYTPILNALKGLNIQISFHNLMTTSIDLHYLKTKPIDSIVLDQSLLRSSLANLQDKSILQSLISIANHMGLKTIAEGIQSADELTLLQQQQCIYGYGDHLCRPLKSEDLATTMAADGNTALRLIK